MSRARPTAPPAPPSPLEKLQQHPMVANIKQKGIHHKNEVENWLRSGDNFLTPYLTTLESKTGVNRVYVFFGLVGLLTLYLLWGPNAGFLSHIIAFAYPAIASLKALETRQKDDDTKWLTYWVVFGFLGIFEFFGEYLLNFLPFYHVVKLGFQVWLMTDGALIFYQRILRPLAVRFLHIDQGTLKGQIRNAKDTATSFVRETETRVRQDLNKME